MSESCETCKYCLDLEQWDYTDVKHKGVPKKKMSGYACMIFAHEGLCIHMVGGSKRYDMCECYTNKEI